MDIAVMCLGFSITTLVLLFFAIWWAYRKGMEKVVDWVEENLRDIPCPTTPYERKDCKLFEIPKWQAFKEERWI